MSERNYNYIFSKLVNAEDDVVGLLAYAIYKQQKIEYIEDFTKKHGGRGPTDEELAPFNEPTSQNKQIENYKNIAETRFGDFLDRLMRRRLEEFKEAQKTAHKEALLEAFTSVRNESHREVVQQLTPSKLMKFGEMALSGIWRAGLRPSARPEMPSCGDQVGKGLQTAHGPGQHPQRQRMEV